MTSIWADPINLPAFPALEKNTKTDVLIIGGGMAGLLCAYFLSQSGIRYILAEAKTICSGISKNTTAKITSQHGLIYQKLIREFGTENASAYLEANQAALKQYREICRGIDCDFEEKDSYVYSRNNYRKIISELDSLRQIGFPAKLMEQLPLPFPIAGAIKFPQQAQFHPMKFIAAIAAKLNIYEHTFVKELRVLKSGCYQATCESCQIQAEKVIVATHFPFINKHGSYFLKMYQHRSYTIAIQNSFSSEKAQTEGLALGKASFPITDDLNLNGMYVDESEKGMSFRNYQNYLLIGGGGHRTGKQGGNYSELRHFARLHYPSATERYCFAAQDCMTLDSVPYIGKYSKNTPNLYVATGFNKWGITGSMVSAMILSDIIMEKKNPYAFVFSPARTMLRPQLAVNGLEAIANLLAITPRRCPHLGCALKWNPCEHSWDCPCHGSRFTEKGKLIDNPATGNLKTYRDNINL